MGRVSRGILVDFNSTESLRGVGWVAPPNSQPPKEGGRLLLIASPDRTVDALLIHQNARVYAGLLNGKESEPPR